MKLLLASLILVSSAAHAWSAAGVAAYAQVQTPQYQQQRYQAPQPTYSERYNAGYMAGYLTRNGYAAPDTNYGGGAYQQGYNAGYEQ
jgi:hypothetical protein